MYLLSYVVAYFLVMFSTWFVFPAAIVLVLLIRRFVSRQIAALILLPITKFLLEVTGTVLAIWVATVLMDKMGTKPVLLMFLLPGVLAYWNTKERLALSKRGVSVVRMMVEGEEAAYDQVADVRAKRAEHWGEMVGLGTGILLFLTDTSFV